MGNYLSCSATYLFKGRKALPIDTKYQPPSSLPIWPQGEGFAGKTINLGGIEVCQISSFSKVWAVTEGGQDNLGATFFEPSQLPAGFFMLGCYSQPNNKPLFGWVLAAKDDGNGNLERPVDFKLIWSSENMKINQDGNGYIWLPISPEGYEALGHVVTNSPQKPSLENIRCVRSNFTDKSENDLWIWGRQGNPNGINIYGLRPATRGIQSVGVCVGTFIVQVDGAASPTFQPCLKNNSPNFSCMPNPSQITALLQSYSPIVYLHPDEQYLPSSVTWLFDNGALLYEQGNESNPVPIDPSGSNLPQDGSNDDKYWIDLPIDGGAKERVKKGNLQSAGAYVHVKSMIGGTFTDIAIWVFYPFNGPAKAKVEFINISLGKIGEHVGDWEHVTLRISNFTGMLWKVFFSEHSGGTWVDASQLEFQGGNKVVTYASLHGHAFYSKPGLVLQGNTKLGIGIRNDTAKSKLFMDTGVGFEVVAAEYLGNIVVEPPWLKFGRKWGPKISYDINAELKKVEKLLPGKLKSLLEGIVNGLPREVLGEDGPTGPKMKNNWAGDEI